MPDIAVTIDLYCSCGCHMCSYGIAGEKYGRPCFIIEPCPECLEKAKDEGYTRGLEEGRHEVESEKGE